MHLFLPAVVPALGYQDLDVQDGRSAARSYYRMMFEEGDWVEQERIAQSLSRYCERDTWAMLQIRRVLKEKVAYLSRNRHDPDGSMPPA